MMMLSLAVVCSIQFAAAQGKAVSGKVSDAGGNPLPGVSVTVKGTAQGAISDAAGKYSVQAANGATLVFSYIGYKAQEVKVGSQNTINVALEEDAAALNEVIVVGYGSQKKSQTTGAISQVSAKQITEMPITSLGQALQGRTAGLTFHNQVRNQVQLLKS